MSNGRFAFPMLPPTHKEVLEILMQVKRNLTLNHYSNRQQSDHPKPTLNKICSQQFPKLIKKSHTKAAQSASRSVKNSDVLLSFSLVTPVGRIHCIPL